MIKIKSIEFREHKIFGNKVFDFTKDDGTIPNNIILAGENGTGKTTFLQEIYYLMQNSFSNTGFNYSRITTIVEIDLSDEGYFFNEIPRREINKVKLTLSFNDANQHGYRSEFIGVDGISGPNVGKEGLADPVYTFNLKSIFSTVDINYSPKRSVIGPNDKTLDTNEINIPDDLANEIIQLLININIQDSTDLNSWVSEHRSELPPEEVINIRMKRFSKAFEKMFDNKITFSKIRNNTVPIFKKNGNEIEITSLSSGEKQIVFRGVYLLRNSGSLKGIPILIDEPELSMHPKWEERVFDYYKEIFSYEGKQTSQIFIATHSEHILKSSMVYEDSMVIKISNNDVNKKYYKGSSGEILPTITLAEIKYNIFDMITTDFHIMLYGHIQENFVLDASGNKPTVQSIAIADTWLLSKGSTVKEYFKPNNTTTVADYGSLSTYIRNCIDHPDNSHSYTYDELKQSIEFMINLII